MVADRQRSSATITNELKFAQATPAHDHPELERRLWPEFIMQTSRGQGDVFGLENFGRGKKAVDFDFGIFCAIRSVDHVDHFIFSQVSADGSPGSGG